jgi:CMP-N-acetylneuraminic acid synthetase
MRNIAIIPLRKNSRRFPGKNFYNIGEDPLFGLVGKVALKSGIFSDVYIAIEDTSEIKEYCINNDLKIFKRSKKSAIDNAQTEDVLLEFIDSINIQNSDWVTLIQATCPFQSNEYFQDLQKQINKGCFNSVLTRIKFKRFFIDEVIDDGFIRSRTQDMDERFLETGLFWSFRAKNFMKSKNRIIKPVGYVDIKSGDDVDIDYKHDLDLILSRLIKEINS